ncbi:MAG: lysylphosphatidylglycerol synthase transmembrane domain-containing protein, partial [Anaerolineales bacterium]
LAGILFLLLDYAAFLCVLTLGLFVLFRRNDLNAPEIIASLILFFLALGLGSMIYIGMRSSTALGKILAWFARKINSILYPLIHRKYLSEERAISFSNEVAEGLIVLRENPRKLILPFLHNLLNKILLVFILFLIFVAFKAPISLGTIIAGWSMGYLFMIISPTPAGIGFVEGAMTLTISSFYISLSAATILSLAYRGVVFWFPLLIGFLAFRNLGNIEKPSLTE